MKADTFRTLAHTIYGRGWQTKLARALGRKHSTIWRMAHGQTPVQQYVVAHLEQLAQHAAK